MALYRRKNSPWYWVDVSVGGHRFRRCTKTDDAATARAVETRLRHDLIFENIAGQKPRLTLDRACGFYWQNHAADLPTADDIEHRLKTLIQGLGGDTDLNRLTDAAIATHIARRRGTVSRHGRPLSPASINREISTLRAVIRAAAGRLGVEAPSINWRAHWLREPEARSRYLTPAEARRLIVCAAPHLKGPIEFALLTGLRLGNVIGLDWREVDLAARQITVTQKGGTAHTVPVTEPLLVLLANIGPRAAGPVFTYTPRSSAGGNAKPPRPVKSWKRAFATAMESAGIQNLRWHDLRHTAASWMVQAGAPLDVVQSVLGHRSITTTQRYAHRETTAKAQAMNRAASHWRHTESEQQINYLKIKDKNS